LETKLTTCTKCKRNFHSENRAKPENHTCNNWLLKKRYAYCTKEYGGALVPFVKYLIVPSVDEGFYEVKIGNKSGSNWKLFDKKHFE